MIMHTKKYNAAVWFFVLGVCFVLNPGNVLYGDYDSYVYTPNQTQVPVIVRTYEFSPEEIQEIDDHFTSAYPNATLLRSASRKYNCHSYAWYSQNVNNNKWMNNPSAYWEDGSYQMQEHPKAGDKVYYDVTDSHSAIVESKDTFVSKWGKAPLMRHSPDDCPYDDSKLVYYR